MFGGALGVAGGAFGEACSEGALGALGVQVLGVPLMEALGIGGRVLGEKYIGVVASAFRGALTGVSQVSDPETELLGLRIGTSLMSKMHLKERLKRASVPLPVVGTRCLKYF